MDALTPFERFALALDVLRHKPVPHANVRALVTTAYMRFDASGKPAKPRSTFDGDWTIGLPEDLRVALRTIAEARMYGAARPPDAVAVVEKWLAEHKAKAKPLVSEPRAKYLKAPRPARVRRSG